MNIIDLGLSADELMALQKNAIIINCEGGSEGDWG